MVFFYSFMLPKTSGYEKYYTNAVAVKKCRCRTSFSGSCPSSYFKMAVEY